MTRRPHVKVRAGDVDLVIGYEERGDQWVVYTHSEGQAPSSQNQSFHVTVQGAHSSWLRLVRETVDAISFVPAPSQAALADIIIGDLDEPT